MITPPFLGFGLGLRKPHYDDILATQPQVDWFEILTENYLIDGGKPLQILDQIRARYPIVMHGVSMSIGSTDPLDKNYLTDLKNLANRYEPAWVSDHLCWTGIEHTHLHDLLPLPYTEEAIAHVSDRVNEVQDYLQRPFLLENVSSYITYCDDVMPEWEFLAAVAERADCGILLDINNIYVSSFNHGFNPLDYLDHIPAKRVWQHHLAGHTHTGNIIIDTHDQDVIDPVWALYAEAAKRFGPVSTMIERDDNIPPLNEVLAELQKARDIAEPIYQACAA